MFIFIVSNYFFMYFFLVERTAEEAEKESLKSRMSTLDRNIKLLEQERNCLEEKLRECVKTFSTLRTSIGDVRYF